MQTQRCEQVFIHQDPLVPRHHGFSRQQWAMLVLSLVLGIVSVLVIDRVVLSPSGIGQAVAKTAGR